MEHFLAGRFTRDLEARILYGEKNNIINETGMFKQNISVSFVILMIHFVSIV